MATLGFSIPIGSVGSVNVRLSRQSPGDYVVTLDTAGSLTCLTSESADALAAMIAQARKTADRINRQEKRDALWTAAR